VIEIKPNSAFKEVPNEPVNKNQETPEKSLQMFSGL